MKKIDWNSASGAALIVFSGSVIAAIIGGIFLLLAAERSQPDPTPVPPTATLVFPTANPFTEDLTPKPLVPLIPTPTPNLPTATPTATPTAAPPTPTPVITPTPQPKATPTTAPTSEPPTPTPISTPTPQPTATSTPTSEPDIPSLNARVWVTGLRFYESDNEDVSRKGQRYSQRFSSDTTRYINWVLHLEHPAPGRRIDFTIIAIYYRLNSNTSIWEEIWRQTDDTYVEGDETLSRHESGYGCDDPGDCWENGYYKVDLYVEGKSIVSEQFQIY